VSRFILNYRSSSGEWHEQLVPLNEDKTILTDYKIGSDFTTETYYLPTPTAIDEFMVTNEQSFPEVVLAEKSQFRVIAVSSESVGYEGRNLIDNDLTTMWHSRWEDGTPPPHWLILDLGESLNVAKIELYRRVGDVVDTKTVQLSVSDNPDPNGTWTAIGTLNYSEIIDDDLRSLQTDTNTRYLKLYLPDSNRYPYVQLSEIYIYIK
jgi:hypothetical protein